MNMNYNRPDWFGNATSCTPGGAGRERLSEADERALALAWKNERCREARDRLITSHLWLAGSFARKYAHRGTPLDELVAEAHLGLLEAVENFDPDRGARFSTYAVYWIRHALASVFIRGTSGPRLNRQERADLAALENAKAAWVGSNGTSPSTAEMSGALRWPIDRVRVTELMAISRVRPRSLGASPDVSTIEAEEAGEPGGEGGDAIIQALLNHLNQVERTIVELHFGLNGATPRPISDVAASVRLSPRTTRTRFDFAMRKLTRLGRAVQRPRGLESARRAG